MNVWVELVGVDGVPQRREVATVERPVDGARFDDLGLSLEEGKAIQCRLQEEMTQFQADQAGQQDRECRDCNRVRGIHDYRSRKVYSLFGHVACACLGSAGARAKPRQYRAPEASKRC